MINVKCRYCGKEIEKSTAYKVGSRSYYCNKECYELSETKNKKKYKPEKGTERRSCTDYIQYLYKNASFDDNYMNQSFWAMIGAQLSNIVNQYNTKYSAIKYTLWYMVEIKGMNLFDDNFNGSILNLVGFYLDEAKQYWIETENIKKEIKNFDFTDDVVVHKISKTQKIETHKEISMEDLR
jgi:hypothetical protein